MIDVTPSICPICRERQGVQLHHCFPQTKANRRTYGVLIDKPFNLILVCAECHVSHAEMAGRVEGEAWFRMRAEEAGYTLPPASKTMQAKARFGRM